nr:uncharacterized protein LOC111419651 [Onthophagus taurus]
MIRQQFSMPSQFNNHTFFEEKQQLIKKLKEQLEDAQNVLKGEEHQLLQYENIINTAKMVGQQANKLIINLTAAIGAANKTVARTKQASEKAMGEIILQKKVVEKAKETVKTINEQLKKEERSLTDVKVVPDNENPALLVVFDDDISLNDDSDSESDSSRAAYEANIRRVLK